MRKLFAVLMALWIVGGAVGKPWAYQEPPVNLCATTFLDGGGVPAGFYYINYVQTTQGRSARDLDGKTIPGNGRVNVLANLHQFYYLSTLHVLGGQLAGQVLIPVVAPSAKGNIGPFPLTANTAGLGDLNVGPAIQWNNAKFLGRPFFQRAEVDFSLPTGKYSQDFGVNPGANLLTIDSYYAFTWIVDQNWETSARLWYAISGENHDTKIRPGNLFHMNYAVSRQVLPRWRLGAAGYFLEQMQDDKVDGTAVTGTKERAWALGPGLVYSGEGLIVMISHPEEFGVKNRFVGSRTTFELVHKF